MMGKVMLGPNFAIACQGLWRVISRSGVEHEWDRRQEQGDARTRRYAQAAATPRMPIHAQPPRARAEGTWVFCASAASLRGSRRTLFLSDAQNTHVAAPRNEYQQVLA